MFIQQNRNVMFLIYLLSTGIIISACVHSSGQQIVSPHPPSEARKEETQIEIEAQQQQRGTIKERIRAAIEKTLSSQAPVGYAQIPHGVQVLDVQVDNNKITINLSKELLSRGTGSVMEDAIHQILSPLSDVVPEIKNGDYRILIEGIPLNEYLH